MVPRDVDHRLIREGIANPSEAVSLDVDVAREHNQIGIDLGQRDRAELKVQVAEDADSHETARCELAKHGNGHRTGKRCGELPLLALDH